MKIKIAFSLLLALALSTGPVAVFAQQPENKTDKGQPAEKTDKGQPAQSDAAKIEPYSITTSIEIGVRGVSVNDNADKYRSDLNYDPGVRVFSSSLLMQSKNNDGKLFDTLLVNSFGWKGDPSQYLRVNMEKTRWYKFDGSYRQIDYFNSLRNFALNQHIFETQHRLGDFDLTLLPQNDRIRFNVGYSLERNTGPATSTFDYARDEFPILAPARLTANDYRFGVDAKAWVFDLSFLQGFRYFKEDTEYTIDVPQVGNNPLNTSVLNTFSRDLPTRGRVPYTRFSLHTLLNNKVDITGRVIYSNATTNFALFETLTGTDATGANILLNEFVATGDTRRPSTIGDLGVTVFATDRLRLSNTFRIYTYHIDGGRRFFDKLFRNRTTSSGGVLDLPPLLVETLAFRTTSSRRATNTAEVDYEFHPRLTAHFGHRYSDRRVELSALDEQVGQTILDPEHFETFDNRTNSFFFGFKARPMDVWSVYFDYEHGESDNVFTRVDNYDYTNFRLRSIVRPSRALAFNASIVTRDNTNPTLTPDFPRREFGADINSRIFVGSVDWTPNEKFGLSSGYTHTHVTSEAQVIFFFNSLRQDGISRYFMKDHFAFINTFIQFHPRVSLTTGYRFQKDAGQGNRVPASPAELIGSYPLQFQTPEFRLAVRMTKNVEWIAGYQWYDYKERFQNIQHYNAHLPYTSLRISFDRGRGE
jgi:hypothetical protein